MLVLILQKFVADSSASVVKLKKCAVLSPRTYIYIYVYLIMPPTGLKAKRKMQIPYS